MRTARRPARSRRNLEAIDRRPAGLSRAVAQFHRNKTISLLAGNMTWLTLNIAAQTAADGGGPLRLSEDETKEHRI